MALQITPAIGATDVTVDAPVRVDYPAGQLDAIWSPMRAGNFIVLRTTEGGMPVAGSSQRQGDSVFFVPAAALAAFTDYDGTVTEDAADRLRPFRFTTGSERDQRAPLLGDDLQVTSTKVGDSCTTGKGGKGGFRIDVSFPPASDDGPPGSLEYLLHLTRASNLPEPQLRARQRNFATDRIGMSLLLRNDEAEEAICVAVHPIDGIGRVGEGRTTCLDPVDSRYFAPLCSASAGGIRAADLAGGTMTIGLFLLLARRRRGRR